MLIFCGSLQYVKKRMRNGEIFEDMKKYLAKLRDEYNLDNNYLCRDTVLGYFAVDSDECYVDSEEMKSRHPSSFTADFRNLILEAYDEVFSEESSEEISKDDLPVGSVITLLYPTEEVDLIKGGIVVAQNKPIQRSIRMTEEVAYYIDNYCGDGFSDKLENLVMDALLGEKQRLARLHELDMRIQYSQERLDGLQKDYEVFKRVASTCEYMEREFDRMITRVKAHVSQTGAAAPAGKI